MINFSVRNTFDLGAMIAKSNAATKRAQYLLDDQVLKDSNKYAPLRDGILIASGLSHSRIGQGFIKWQTPYARRLYYNPQYNFSTDRNPLAGGLWFERAKAQHKGNWLKQAGVGYKQHFGR